MNQKSNGKTCFGICVNARNNGVGAGPEGYEVQIDIIRFETFQEGVEKRKD